jgi:hypothetical protein
MVILTDIRVFFSRLFAILLAGSLILSCEEEAYDEATHEKDLAAFHTVELNSVFDVYLIQDSIYSLKIAADQAVIKNVVYSVEEGILRIENTSRLKWLNPETNKVKLYIRANRLAQVLANETCYIKSLNPIVSDEFSVVMGHDPKLAELDLELNNGSFFYWNNHQCGGKLTLRGKTSVLLAYTFGYMSVDAVSLRTDNAIVENNSKGDFEVWVNDKIEYSIRGLGDIYLYGNPAEVVLNERTSRGELIKVN